jgi:hypothetical protein
LFYRGDGGDFLSWKDSLSAAALQWGGGERQGMEKHFHLPARGEMFYFLYREEVLLSGGFVIELKYPRVQRSYRTS